MDIAIASVENTKDVAIEKSDMHIYLQTGDMSQLFISMTMR